MFKCDCTAVSASKDLGLFCFLSSGDSSKSWWWKSLQFNEPREPQWGSTTVASLDVTRFIQNSCRALTFRTASICQHAPELCSQLKISESFARVKANVQLFFVNLGIYVLKIKKIKFTKYRVTDVLGL